MVMLIVNSTWYFHYGTNYLNNKHDNYDDDAVDNDDGDDVGNASNENINNCETIMNKMRFNFS